MTSGSTPLRCVAHGPRADLNRDGKVDGDDESVFVACYDRLSGLSGRWRLSSGLGLAPQTLQALRLAAALGRFGRLRPTLVADG
ncbi:MAG: hypothetical protein K2Q09_01740 [Phycisphaerales bacterium]|nr:hypothetical protein [Phycisphaerales bacterium]